MIVYCPGCGGMLGRDCFNTEECQDIARQKAAAHDAQAVDMLALLDEAQAIERQLRQQKDELQNQLSRIAKILRDFGVVREPQECIEAWLQRSVMAPGVNIAHAVESIIDAWDDWDAEASQAAQQEQNHEAWRFVMRENLTDCIRRHCRE